MSDDAVLAVIDALEELAIGYMLVGSFSTNAYGMPRSTEDADFVVQLGETAIATLASRLKPSFTLDPQSGFEMVTATTKYILQYNETAFTIELFLLSSDPHDLARFERRRRIAHLGRSIVVPSVEDVVVTKVRWLHSQHRAKDREDLENVIGVQRANIDWKYVHRWCDEHGTRELLDEILNAVDEV